MRAPLFLFYEEPDPDRWVPWDRYPRRVIRRIVRGKPQPGGVMRWFLNLRAGFDRLGVAYRLNDYHGLRRSPGAWAHVIGKPHVVEKIPAGHPIIYGPGVAAHPYENNFWGRADLRLTLLSCDWFKAMYDRDLPCPVPTAVWPAGIDTELWRPLSRDNGTTDHRTTNDGTTHDGSTDHRTTDHGTTDYKTTDFLVYDKVRWEYGRYERELLQPIRDELKRHKRTFCEIRYGSYREEDFHTLLQQCRAMIFLCEHETQGFAYLQALSCGVPIFAWDRGGYWQDAAFYPHRVKFSPVSSVPYWDDRCGMKFANIAEFSDRLDAFVEKLQAEAFKPRDYIVENLTLEKCAAAYVRLRESCLK